MQHLPSSTHLHYNVQHDLNNETLPNFIFLKSTQPKGERKKQQERINVQPSESTHKHKPTNGGHYWFGDLKVFPKFGTSWGQPDMGR
jgi:hypothetical protein